MVKTVADQAETTVVTAGVSGTFAGSPVDIRYQFMLNDGKITRLEIR
ncbi:MAG: hypothetical protein KF745_01665 [Phycisphaeraceae bacterium]|nr:hypothetical protein [Phycisphaeraceae bacterium]